LGATVGTTLLTLVISSAGRTILSKLGFQSYQFSRIDTWLNPANDTSGNGYQTYQSLKAIGSGQLTGNGWGKS
jgi:rod shape determining protein RodA